jgi:multiple antibiotic resistance protein
MLQTGLSSFVMLLVTVGPLEAAAIFAGLTAAAADRDRRRMAIRAVCVAGAVLLVFAFGGARLLAVLHISMPAFRLAGGLLLLLVAIDLMFVHPSGLTSITPAEAEEAVHREIDLFPMAIPLIAGPGSMAAIVLLMTESRDLAQMAATTAALVCVLGLTAACLLLAIPVTRLLGVTGVNVAARVSGMVLAALAMQLMIDGVRQSGLLTGLRALP